MILVDLRLALFVLLLVAIGGVIGMWQGIRRAMYQPPSPNKALAQIPNELPFGLVVVHTNGTILQINAVARRLVPRLDSDPATQQSVISHLFGESRQHVTSTSGFIAQPIPLRWWRYPLNDRIVVFLLLDTSENQRLVRRQHTFIGQLSHELRTPLTAVIAHLEVVRNPITSAALHDTSIAIIQHEVHRLARLVRDLLELYRLETSTELPLQSTNVVLVAEEAMAQVFPHAEAQELSLTLEAATPLPYALAQADRLKQVFLNLLDNAVKYGRPGDSIQVCLTAVSDGIHCIIADSGPGIPATDLPHVQEPLYRGRTDIEGSGIGLALACEILRRHQAVLTIESATVPQQSGTICSWILPYAADQVKM